MVKNPNNLSTLPLKSASFKYLYHSGPFHSCKHPLPLEYGQTPYPTPHNVISPPLPTLFLTP